MKTVFISAGVVVVTGSLLPTLVIPFRAYCIRQILGNGGERSAERATNFQGSTMYMAAPCILGIIISALALVVQLSLMLHQSIDRHVLVVCACVGSPIAAATFFCVLRLVFHEDNGMKQTRQHLPNAGAQLSCPLNGVTEQMSQQQYVMPEYGQVQSYDSSGPEYCQDQTFPSAMEVQIHALNLLHAEGVLTVEELTMAKTKCIVQELIYCGDVVLQLQKLKDLLDRGVVSDQEFRMAKAKVVEA